MLDRRSFLIGAGGLLTAAFVRKATAFSRAAGEPLVLPPANRPEETLYVYAQDWVEPPYGKSFCDIPFPADLWLAAARKDRL